MSTDFENGMVFAPRTQQVSFLSWGVALAVGVMGTALVDVRAEDAAEREAIFSWVSLPAPDEAARLSGAFFGVSGDALILAGGSYRSAEHDRNQNAEIYSDQVYVLKDPDGRWEPLDARLPRPLAGGASLPWKDREKNDWLVCLGGEDAHGSYAEAFMLQFRDGQILREDLPPMPSAAAHFSGALVDQTIYIVPGARDSESSSLKAFWSLDLSQNPSDRTWNQLDPWSGPARSRAVTAAQDDAFFLCGGVHTVGNVDGHSHPEFLQDVYRFTPSQGWMQVADLPRTIASAPVPGVALGQTHVLILGGVEDRIPTNPAGGEGRLSSSKAILAYDTTTDTWRTLGTMPDDVSGRASALIHDNALALAMPTTTWWRGRLVLLAARQSPGRLSWAEVHEAAKSGLKYLDYVSLVGYLLVLVSMGIFFSRREKSTNQFFLAGRRLPWWAAGISLFGTQLSAITFMAIPAMVYRTNWVYFVSQLTNILVAVTIIHFYLPFYRRLKVTTAYEYLEKRYNLATRLVGSSAFIFFHLVRMGIILYLPALALSAVTGLNISLCILVMGVLATFYTVLGGIEAVVWSDVLQAVLLLGGALLSFVIISWRVPDGIAGVASLAAAEGKLRIVNLDWDITTAAVWVIVIGGYMNSLGVYSSDQTVVQRYLTTRDERAATRSIWMHISIAIPSATLFFALGTALWAFFKTHPELLDPTGKTDQIFPWFIAGQLPAGVSGLVIAALVAAAMSSLDSSMNSMATAITIDFYGRFRPKATDRHRLRVARVLTAVLGVSGTGVALYTARLGSTSIWDLNFEIAGLFGAGLAGLFAAGVFTRRTSGAGILVGFLASGGVLYFVKYSTTVHFFIYGPAGILSCVLIGWLASWILPSRPKDLAGLTIYSLNQTKRNER